MRATLATFHGVVLSLCFGLVEGAEFPTCPAYRRFKNTGGGNDHLDEFGLSIQYNAPNGCECVEGMGDLNCAFCETDEGCQTENPNHVCRGGVVYAEEDTYKSYKCRVFATLEALFTNGKLSIFVDVAAKTASLSVYNFDMKEPINGEHAVDCELSGCDIRVGGSSGVCELTSKLACQL